MLKEPRANVQRAACGSPAAILFYTNPFFQQSIQSDKNCFKNM